MRVPVVLGSLFAGAVLVLASGASQGGRPDCDRPMTQTDMNVCAGMKAEASEAMLGRLLAEVNARLEQSQRDELTSVQAQWLAYRNAHCAWQARFFDGGSMRPLISADCIDQLTRSRIRELRVNLCEGMTDGCAAAQRYATGGR